MQSFRFLLFTVFEIQGLKLKNKKKKKEAGEELEKLTFCYISHVSRPIVTIFYVPIHIDLGYYPVLSKVDYHLK